MTAAADTSVVVAALVADHLAHDTAAEALARCEATIGHVAIEAYSVLTRLPPPLRADATLAAEVLGKRLSPTCVALSAAAHAGAAARLAAAGVSEGATYDGIIALTALDHHLELISRDRRAARTYRALGVPHVLLS